MTNSLSLTEPIRVTHVTSSAELAQLAGDWDALTGDVPFRSHAWLSTWWQRYAAPHDTLFTLVVRNAAHQVIGICPCYRNSTRTAGRVLRLLGGTEICSDYVSVLGAPELRSEVTRRLADYLAGPVSDEWDLIEFNGLVCNDEATTVLSNEMAARGHIVVASPEQSCWNVELPGDWDTYLSLLSKSRRERIRKLWRQEFQTGRAVMHKVERSEQLAPAFEILADLHQRRRHSLNQPGCFSWERFRRFHWEMVHRLFERGQLRLLWLELDGRPAAAEYGLVSGGTVYYYQGGFDPELADRRPGWLAFTGSLKLAIEEGARRYDFLRGDEAYKASWGAKPVALDHLRVVSRHPLARMRHLAWQAQQTVKRIARQHWKSAGNGPGGNREPDGQDPIVSAGA